MPLFQYKAYNADGKEISGNMEAVSHHEARERLKKEGIYLKELFSSTTKDISLNRWRFRVSLPELAAITHQLSTLLSSGATLYDALSILINEEESKTLKRVLSAVKESISGGSSLAKALEKHPAIFHDVYVRSVEAGEISGTLENILAGLAEYLETRAKVYDQLKTALLYPVLMTLVGTGVLFFLFTFVIPKITGIFEDTHQALPLMTVILLNIAWFLKNDWPFILIGICSAGWGLHKLLKRPKGKEIRDRLLLQLPVLGRIAVKFYMANFARTLGSLLQSGVSILNAIDMTKRVLNNAVFESALNKAGKDVAEGAPLSISLKNSGTFPAILVHVIATGEESGKLDSLLLKAAASYEKDFESAANRLLSLLEPILILAMGVIVGFIVIAILLPIFQLNQIIR